MAAEIGKKFQWDAANTFADIKAKGSDLWANGHQGKRMHAFVESSGVEVRIPSRVMESVRL